jgi:hypothetical protein
MDLECFAAGNLLASQPRRLAHLARPLNNE